MPRTPDHGRGPWLLAAFALLVVVWSLHSPERAAVDAASCERVALVAGALVCDGALQVEDHCGTVHALRSGDTFDPARCEPPARMGADDLEALSVRIDPNLDDADALQSLPGVGPVLAGRIVEGRPYADADALLAVKGIGPRTLARISPRLTFSDPRP